MTKSGQLVFVDFKLHCITRIALYEFNSKIIESFNLSKSTLHNRGVHLYTPESSLLICSVFSYHVFGLILRHLVVLDVVQSVRNLFEHSP